MNRTDHEAKRAALQSFLDFGGEDLVREVLAAYLEQTDGQPTRLRQALELGDLEALRFEAHQLTGASRNVGALTVAELSSEIERAAKSRSVDAVPAALGQLEGALAQTRAEFAERVNRR